METTGKTNRTVGLNAAISDADKHILLSDMVLQLHRGRKAAIEPVMEKVQSYYDIDAISIYIGNDMRRAYSRGEYVNSIEYFASVLKPDYQEFFDKDDFYNGELMQRIEKRCPEVEEFNKQQEISKSVQCLYKNEGVVQALVSFDFFNRSPKIGCLDNGMMLTIGRLMAEIAIES